MNQQDQPDYQQRRTAGNRPATPPQWQQDAPPRDYRQPAGRPAAPGHPNAMPRYEAPWNQPEPQPRDGGPAWTYQQQSQTPAQPRYAPQQPYSPPPSQPPRRPVPVKGLAALGCGGLVALFILVAALTSSTSSDSSSLPASSQPGAATTQAAAPASPVTVATFSGSGIENTPQFTVTGSWALSYSFDCSSFGYAGNFQVYEDGGLNLLTNDLAMSKTAVTNQYDDAGTHYLEVNSECSWSVKVIDEGS